MGKKTNWGKWQNGTFPTLTCWTVKNLGQSCNYWEHRWGASATCSSWYCETVTLWDSPDTKKQRFVAQVAWKTRIESNPGWWQSSNDCFNPTILNNLATLLIYQFHVLNLDMQTDSQGLPRCLKQLSKPVASPLRAYLMQFKICQCTSLWNAGKWQCSGCKTCAQYNININNQGLASSNLD